MESKHIKFDAIRLSSKSTFEWALRFFKTKNLSSDSNFTGEKIFFWVPIEMIFCQNILQTLFYEIVRHN